uniref:Putative n2n2-dimethylguanosine trna methyltransferase n=1 Tax=Triatoma infestans TaxID=30076 RepID=A0A023F945_TRIIF
MADRIFLREVKLENIKKTLLFYQHSVGNVSCVVWDAALVLAKYLEKRSGQYDSWLKGRKIIELGAGLGCVGIAAACYGGDVILTDLPDVVPQLLKTIDLNRTAWSDRGQVNAAALTWGQNKQNNIETLKVPADIILLSDCVYYEESLDPLIETIKLLSSDTTEIILSQEKRDTEKQQEIWKQFLIKFNEVFTVNKVPLNEQDELYASPDIFLLRAHKKSNT